MARDTTVLAAGTLGVRVQQSLHGLRLSWRSHRWNRRWTHYAWLASLMALLSALGAGTPGLSFDPSTPGGLLLVCMVVLLVLPTPVFSYVRFATRRSELRITSDGLFMGERLIAEPGADVQPKLVVHEGGAAIRATEATVTNLILHQSRDKGELPQPRKPCGVDLEVDGEVIAIGRLMEAASALALYEALEEHLPAAIGERRYAAEGDSEALEALEALRTDAVGSRAAPRDKVPG